MNVDCKTFQQLTAQELYGLLRLRQEVFVVEQNCPYLDSDGVDLLATHFLIQQGQDTGRTVSAYARLYWDEKGENLVRLGRVVTAQALRKQGLGAKIVQAALDFAGQHHRPHSVEIHAQEVAMGFYQHFGFVAQGESFLEDGIPHRVMVKIMG